MDMAIPFGQTLLLWRKHRGLTQAQLAARARVPRPNLSAIERGRREVSLSTLRALALALDVRAGLLVDGIAPGVDVKKSASLSRRELERIADAVVHGTPVKAPVRPVVDALRKVTKHRALSIKRRPATIRDGRRATEYAWLFLESAYPPAVLHSLLDRIADRYWVEVHHDEAAD